MAVMLGTMLKSFSSVSLSTEGSNPPTNTWVTRNNKKCRKKTYQHCSSLGLVSSLTYLTITLWVTLSLISWRDISILVTFEAIVTPMSIYIEVVSRIETRVSTLLKMKYWQIIYRVHSSWLLVVVSSITWFSNSRITLFFYK